MANPNANVNVLCRVTLQVAHPNAGNAATFYRRHFNATDEGRTRFTVETNRGHSMVGSSHFLVVGGVRVEVSDSRVGPDDQRNFVVLKLSVDGDPLRFAQSALNEGAALVNHETAGHETTLVVVRDPFGHFWTIMSNDVHQP